MSSLNWLFGFIGGAFITSLTITYVGITARFRIPFTKLLIEAKAIEKGDQILKTFTTASFVLGLVYAASLALVVFVFPKALWGFIIGSVALTLLGVRSWGWTITNFHSYLTNYGRFIDEDADLKTIIGERLPIKSMHKGDGPERDAA